MKNIAIVTGASSGIGKSFLKTIIKERGIFGGVPFDEVWAVARRADKLNEIIDSLGDDRVLPVTCDLSDPDNLAELEEQLAAEKPQVGRLVNCAGIGFKGAVEDQTAKALEDTLDINCTALSKLTRICLPYMIEKDKYLSKANGPRSRGQRTKASKHISTYRPVNTGRTKRKYTSRSPIKRGA